MRSQSIERISIIYSPFFAEQSLSLPLGIKFKVESICLCMFCGYGDDKGESELYGEGQALLLAMRLPAENLKTLRKLQHTHVLISDPQLPQWVTSESVEIEQKNEQYEIETKFIRNLILLHKEVETRKSNE